ncbi:MAG: phosphonate ABC transporter, permease protein PhnE [candidate division NC10 bacterium]|nr:phosphonate ABC transporter, permease protein PhnE [candidate division NC10 bacterium]
MAWQAPTIRAIPGPPRAAVTTWLGWAALAGALVWSYRGTAADIGAVLGPEGLAQMAAYVRRLFPPDLSPALLREAAIGSAETFAISFLGTLLAVVIAFGLVFFASANLAFAGLLFEMERPVVRAARLLFYGTARGLLNLLRTVPELVWAILFVFMVGLGPFPGVLALGVHTGGVLGKLFAEVLENVDPRPIEALQGTGAGRLQVLAYGILPQALPHFLSYTLYRWEVNIRVAAIMGFVGAGGLGQRIHIAISLFLEHQLLTLVLAIYFLVTAVDALSAFLRRRLL